MTGAHFRDYHLHLDEHSDQIFAMTDDVAARACKIGTTLHSIGDVVRSQRLHDNEEESVSPKESDLRRKSGRACALSRVRDRFYGRRATFFEVDLPNLNRRRV